MNALRGIDDRNAPTIALGFILLVFIAGLGYSVYLGDFLRFPDEQEYYALAKNLHRHSIFSLDGTSPIASKPPGYPFLLAIVMQLSESVLFIRVLNFLAFSCSLGILFLLARRHATNGTGLLSMILALGYPVFFYTASTLYPQTIGATLFMLILLITDRKQRLGIGSSIAVGLLFGYLVLTIPIFVSLMGVMLLWRMFTLHDRSSLVLIVLITLLVQIPWTIRNYQLYHSFVFVTTDGGMNLLLGNSEYTTPNAGPNTNVSKYTLVVTGTKLNEAEADQFYKEQVIRWILDHPADAVKLYVLKFMNHFNFRNDLYTISESSILRDLISAATYLPLLSLFLTRIITWRVVPMSRFEWFLCILYVAWGLIMAIFFTRIRYRLPLDFVLVMIDALFLQQLSKLLPQAKSSWMSGKWLALFMPAAKEN